MDKLMVMLHKEVVDKILWMTEENHTEVLGLGVAISKDKPLIITDFYTMKQTCTMSTVDVDDAGFAGLINKLTEYVEPIQLRVWIHTHPFEGKPVPSSTDWETFKTLHKHCKWSVMVIISKNRLFTGYLLHESFPEQPLELTVKEYDGVDIEKRKAWEKELKDNVAAKTYEVYTYTDTGYDLDKEEDRWWDEHNKKKNEKKNHDGDLVIVDGTEDTKKIVVVGGTDKRLDVYCDLCGFKTINPWVCPNCKRSYCPKCEPYTRLMCPKCGEEFCTECCTVNGWCPKCGNRISERED